MLLSTARSTARILIGSTRSCVYDLARDQVSCFSAYSQRPFHSTSQRNRGEGRVKGRRTIKYKKRNIPVLVPRAPDLAAPVRALPKEARAEEFRSIVPSHSFMKPSSFLVRQHSIEMAEAEFQDKKARGLWQPGKGIVLPDETQENEMRTWPPLDYMQLSDPTQSSIQEAPRGPKLLVLDLNGALLYRSTTRSAHPRPYLRPFLQYIFSGPASGSESEVDRPYEVFVWSSAQPHNVRYMVEYAFGPWAEGLYQGVDANQATDADPRDRSGKLLGVWARDKMDLKPSDYHKKVQTHKDLRKLWAHLDPSGRKFNVSNTILIDDSFMKAIYQPWNHIAISEYEQGDHREAIALAANPALALQTPLEMDSRRMDSFLLAVTGMLEEMRDVPNVPVWLRRGSLSRLPRENMSGDHLQRRSPGSPPPNIRKDGNVVLPTDSEYTPWWKEDGAVKYWISAGVQALRGRNIPIDHGLPRPRGVTEFNLDGVKRGRSSPASRHSPPPRPTGFDEGRTSWPRSGQRQYSTSASERAQLQEAGGGFMEGGSARDKWRVRSVGPGSSSQGRTGMDELVDGSTYPSFALGQYADNAYPWQAGPSIMALRESNLYPAETSHIGSSGGPYYSPPQTPQSDKEGAIYDMRRYGVLPRDTALPWLIEDEGRFLEEVFEQYGEFRIICGQRIPISNSSSHNDIARGMRRNSIVSALRRRFDSRALWTGRPAMFPLEDDPMYRWLEAKRSYDPDNSAITLALRRWRAAFVMIQEAPSEGISLDYWREYHDQVMRLRGQDGVPFIPVEQWRLSLLETDFRAQVLPVIEESERRSYSTQAREQAAREQAQATRQTNRSWSHAQLPHYQTTSSDTPPPTSFKYAPDLITQTPQDNHSSFLQKHVDFLAHSLSVFLCSLIHVLGPFPVVGGVIIDGGNNTDHIRKPSSISRRGMSLLSGLAHLPPPEPWELYRLGSNLAALWRELGSPYDARTFGAVLERWKQARMVIVHQTEKWLGGAENRGGKSEAKMWARWTEMYEENLPVGLARPSLLEWRLGLLDQSLRKALHKRAEERWQGAIPTGLGKSNDSLPVDPVTAAIQTQYDHALATGEIDARVTVEQFGAILSLINMQQEKWAAHAPRLPKQSVGKAGQASVVRKMSKAAKKRARLQAASNGPRQANRPAVTQAAPKPASGLQGKTNGKAGSVRAPKSGPSVKASGSVKTVKAPAQAVGTAAEAVPSNARKKKAKSTGQTVKAKQGLQGTMTPRAAKRKVKKERKKQEASSGAKGRGGGNN